jgi:AraC-like DNA-binding protein
MNKGQEIKSVATPPLPPERRHEGAARVGPMMALPGLLAEMGVPPRRAFARAKVRLSVFADADNYLEYAAGGRLLAACVQLTGCPHFALLVGARSTLADFGLLAPLMRHSPTVGEALRVLMLQLYLFDSVAVPVLVQVDASNVLLGYSATLRDMLAVDQVQDIGIAVAFKLMRELGGATWKPLQVQFAHRAPSTAAAYRRLFGAPVHFDSEISGMIFPATWLDRPIDGADPEAARQARQALHDALPADPGPFSYQVQRVLHQMLAATCPSSDEVARLFAISPRALRLRLSAESTSFQQLLDQVRFAMARQLMQHTRMDLTAVAAALRYADLPGFSRAFRKWAAVSPRDCRLRHGQGTP